MNDKLNRKRKRTNINNKHIKTNFNHMMNTKNKYYDNPPDFKMLGEKYEEFGKHVFMNKYGDYNIDWKDKDAVKILTKTLLYHDFSVKYWDIPNNFLVPSVTSRLNYLLWIKDLLALFPKVCEREILGIDVGVGANCIYPLIGNQEFGWKFVCSDINKEALGIADKIIKKNILETSIKLVHQTDEKKIFENVIIDHIFYHFNICNPPYFDIHEIKENNPKKHCEFNIYETNCEGGEEAFIKNMIKESERYKDNVLLFSSLVGRKKTLKIIIKELRTINEIKMIFKTEFYQGNQVRWGICWTYFEKDDDALKILKEKEKINTKKKENLYSGKIRIKNWTNSIKQTKLSEILLEL